MPEGALPPGVRARAAFGPETHAQAANLTCGNYLPSRRAAELMAAMAGVGVSLGWIAGVRAKTAALVESSGFTDLVAGLLRRAEAVHAGETPARTAGGLRCVHLACTPYLARVRTGDRSADAVDAGGVLPGYQGILVRDGYHGGCGHLTGALHAWCGAHLLRDLKDLCEFEPRQQDWARQMAGLLIEAHVTPPAVPARRGGRPLTWTSWAASRAATRPSPRRGSPRTSTGRPRPQPMRAGPPAGS